tara:strand:- start:120 stop:491 length:372 start_codon:yes stop_codon:yes gene_type:complete
MNQFFYNFYVVSKFKIDDRLTKTYGYCENSSYGFISDIFKLYKIKKNIPILNDNPNFSFNNSVWFKYIPNKEFDEKKIILLNNKNSIEFLNNNKVRLIFKSKDYGIFSILTQFEDCYYLEKND